MLRPRSRDKAGEHRALMKAAVGRDAAQACDLIARHIQSTTDNVIKYASELISDS
jgi:GntR family transcriptional regulator, carbon starvation induced regulator